MSERKKNISCRDRQLKALSWEVPKEKLGNISTHWSFDS